MFNAYTKIFKNHNNNNKREEKKLQAYTSTCKHYLQHFSSNNNNKSNYIDNKYNDFVYDDNDVNVQVPTDFLSRFLSNRTKLTQKFLRVKYRKMVLVKKKINYIKT